MSNVIPFASAKDTPAMLRKLANDIESGDYGETGSTIVVMEAATELALFFFGLDAGADDLARSIGLLYLAQQDLAHTYHCDR